MTVTELGMCHYFATVGNTMAYSREAEVSRISSNSPQIVGAVHYCKRIIFWDGIVGPYTLHTIAV